MSDLQISKTYTSNAFLDYILYYVKKMEFNSVVKDEDEAERNETPESIVAGDVYISCVENRVMFELFDYGKEELNAVGITDPYLVSKCINDRTNIPLAKRDEITEVARQHYIRDYNETNDYYRMICGLPPVNGYGIPIRDYEYHFVGGINPWNATYIHELDHEAIMYLDQKRILREIKMDYPDAKYLDYITCGITPYTARKAEMYSMLYCDDGDGGVLKEKFVRKYNENRLYTMATFYSEGLKMSSDYYTNFIGVMIMIMTVVDMLAELPEHIVKKDLMDKRCIQFIFDMYGIPYYNSIPLKYQYRMCKNVNQLIRYKSSAQGMLNLIDLFGAENIEIFKYFILRDRNIDKWGDVILKQIESDNLDKNELILHDEALVHGPYPKNTILDIPYPIDNFLEYGNVMVVFGDGIELVRDQDYTINTEGQLVLNKAVIDIRYDFYFRKNEEDIPVDDTNGLIIGSETFSISSNTFKFNPPYKSYINDGNVIIVSLGGAILGKDQYTVNAYNNTITIDSSFETTTVNVLDQTTVTSRNVTLIYLYGTNIKSNFLKTAVTATTNNQRVFTVPEPFKNYLANDNAFFVTYKNTFIQNNRYTIDVDAGTLTLTDIEVPKDAELIFYFIYATAAVYQDVVIETKVIKFTVTEDFQTIFSLVEKDEEGKEHSLLPFDNYLSTGYKAYVRIRGNKRMLDQDYYDIYGKSLVLRDTTMYLRVGEEVELTFVYGPHQTMDSLEFTKREVVSTENYQTEFTVDMPTEEFFTKYNGAVIVDIFGNYLEPSDYTLDDNGNFVITNLDKTPAANEKINFTFIRTVVSENSIVSQQQYPSIGLSEDGKPRFNITYPFANYFETNQSVLVFHNSVLISPSRVHHYEEKVNNTIVHYLLLDEPLEDYKSTDAVTILFLFNYKYVREYEESIDNVVIEKNIEEIIDDKLVMTIPFPYSSYIENGWFMYITDEDKNVVYRSDNDETGIDSVDYPCEMIGNSLTFVDSSVIPEYDKLIFHFVYFDSPNLIYKSTEEDYDANYTLKFIGVPLSEPYFSRELMRKLNVLPYDIATMEDSFWDGVSYDVDKNQLHTKVKRQILRKKFNYERTKYFGINYIINIAEMTFRISYFYNMIYDKYFIENNLNIAVPTIAPYRSFNIAYLFCYMTALTYEFTGVDDYIVSSYEPTLYIKGFNFGADMEKLKRWLQDNRRYLKDFPVWDFITADNLDDVIIGDDHVSDGNGQIKDMESFIKIFVTNKKVYDLIVTNIWKSEDYDIYSIWKKFYDTLMTIELSWEFYKVTLTREGLIALGYLDPAHEDQYVGPLPGEVIVARTFHELLYYKDIELYNDILFIEASDDEIQKNDLIIDRIGDIVYLLEEYMDSDEFRNIYDSFPGVSGDSLVEYLFNIINFFKSYKVVLRSKGDFIVFSADDPMLNTIKLIDVKSPEVHLYKCEYIAPVENIAIGVGLVMDDHINFVEKMQFTRNITSGVPERFLPLPEDYPYKTDTITKIKVKRTENQYITIFTSDGSSFTTDITPGWISSYNKNGDYIGMVTYLTPYLRDEDATRDHMSIKLTADNSTPIEASEQYMSIDTLPDSIFKTKIVDPTKNLKHSLIRDTSPDKDYIEFEVEYGTEFYVYVTPSPGWTAGVLNIKYGKAFDDDIYVEVTDATAVMKELNIFQSGNQTITVYNSMVSYKESATVRYGSEFSVKIEPDEGYNTGDIIIRPDSAVIDHNRIAVLQNVSVSATEATLKKVTVRIVSPAHENIALNINDRTIFVEAGDTETISVDYFSPYSAVVYSHNQYTAGELNIPSSGIINKEVMLDDGTVLVTAEPAKLNTYEVRVKQSAHQTITVHYNGTSYSEDGTLVLDINTHIICTILSEDGFIAGTLNITDRYINENIIIEATPAIEARELLIDIDSKENQTITVIYDGNSYTEDFYVPFGSSYTSTLTPHKGYTTDAEIVNGHSEELRENVVVYASKDATPNENNITIINPDNVHQTVRVYVNEDQTEENVKTESFKTLSGNTIRGEVVTSSEEFIPGTLNIGTSVITVDEDIVVIATAPTDINKVNVTVDTVEHQNIVVRYDGFTYESGSTFTADAETSCEVRVEPDEGYEFTKSDFVPSYTFLKNGLPVLITADPPILAGYTITIEQKEHQTIVVTGTSREINPDGTYTEIDNYSTTESDTLFIYGTIFTVDIFADTGYEPGILNITAGTVEEGIVINATDPTPIEED